MRIGSSNVFLPKRFKLLEDVEDLGKAGDVYVRGLYEAINGKRSDWYWAEKAPLADKNFIHKNVVKEQIKKFD